MDESIQRRYRCNHDKMMVELRCHCVAQDSCNNGRKTIFIVEDDIYQLNELYELFSSMGFYCRTYSSPKMALEEIREFWCDIILTDILMPEMDGISFADLVHNEDLSELIMIMSSLDADAIVSVSAE